MFLSELCVVGAMLIAELHPVSKGEDERSRAFLSGAVLAASAVALVAFLAIAQFTLPWLFELPHAHGLTDPLLWASAAMVGVILRGPSIYLSLQAIRLAGTTTYIAAMASLPLAAFAFEAVFVVLGILVAEPFEPITLSYGTFCVIGGSVVLGARASIRSRQ